LFTKILAQQPSLKNPPKTAISSDNMQTIWYINKVFFSFFFCRCSLNFCVSSSFLSFFLVIDKKNVEAAFLSINSLLALITYLYQQKMKGKRLLIKFLSKNLTRVFRLFSFCLWWWWLVNDCEGLFCCVNNLVNLKFLDLM